MLRLTEQKKRLLKSKQLQKTLTHQKVKVPPGFDVWCWWTNRYEPPIELFLCEWTFQRGNIAPNWCNVGFLISEQFCQKANPVKVGKLSVWEGSHHWHASSRENTLRTNKIVLRSVQHFFLNWKGNHHLWGTTVMGKKILNDCDQQSLKN